MRTSKPKGLNRIAKIHYHNKAILLTDSSALLLTGVLLVTPFYAPRFISDWYNATARDNNSALITIRHGLDQYPAKVDVQIKVHVNDQDNIFTGVGSAQRDDDLDYEYGGIVYKYNTDHVLLSTPFSAKDGIGSDKGGIAFLGIAI